MLFFTTGCSVEREVTIRTNPRGAAVFINGHRKGISPVTKTVRWEKGSDEISFKASKSGFEDDEKYITGKEAKKKEKEFEIFLNLPGIKRIVNITTVPVGAKVKINGKEIGNSPITGYEYQWTNQEPEMKVSASMHRFETTTVTYNRTKANKEKKEFEIEIKLPELIKNATLIINAEPVNIGVDVLEVKAHVNGLQIQTPKPTTKHPISFTRSDSKTAFSKVKLRLSCPRSYPSVVNDEIMPEPKEVISYETSLSKNDIDSDGNIIVNATFEPVRVYATVYKELVVTSSGLEERKRVVYATTYENWETEPSMAQVTRMRNSKFKKDELFITRLSTNPTKKDQVILSVPRYDAKHKLIDMQIVEFGNAAGIEQTTDPTYDYDMHPTYSYDGSTVYFASDREDSRMNIYSRNQGPQGAPGITSYLKAGDNLNIEPVVNPDTGVVAFASIDKFAGIRIQTFIPGNSNPTDFGSGHSPDWSPDGKKLLWIERDRVKKEDVIRSLDVTGMNEPIKQVTADKIEGAKWHHDGEHIIYAKASGIHSVTEQPNFDIYAYSLKTGDSTRLTTNGSYDTQPAVTADGKYIYFISNREAGMGEDSGDWQVFRMDGKMKQSIGDTVVNDKENEF